MLLSSIVYVNRLRESVPYGPLWFFLPFVIVFVVYIYYYLKVHELHFFKLFKYQVPLSKERVHILNNAIPFYNNLSVNNKEIFRKRVQHFLLNKTFTSDSSIEVTEEMKVMIAATSVQILFGVEAYYLSHFINIHLRYGEEQEIRYLRQTKNIVIKWNAFDKGYHSLEDGYNPGLKVMAMALSLEHQLNHHSKNMFNRHTLATFDKVYKIQAQKYILSGKSIYKDYKEVDRSEYFAVAVEYFFERPSHFYANQPEMYLALSKLLRQDPLGNYKYKRR